MDEVIIIHSKEELEKLVREVDNGTILKIWFDQGKENDEEDGCARATVPV